MRNLEQRISQLEAELRGVVRLNRRLRVFMPLTVGVASLPFVLGWARADIADFDVVRAKQIQIRSTAGNTTVLIGTGASFGSTTSTGGLIHLTDAAGQIVAQLDGFTNSGGTLRLLEAGTPNSSSNTGLVQLAVERFKFTNKVEGVIKLYSKNSGPVALRMQSGPNTPAQLLFSNGSRGTLISMGSDSSRNGVISVKDRDGRSECLIEAIAPAPLVNVPRTTIQAKRPGTSTAPVAQTAGGGSLTLKGPAGNVTFKAPGETRKP
jgi:hypothetical protein